MAETQKKDKMSEGIKAEINKQKKEQGQKGIGEYDEAPGGGSPGTGGRGGMHKNFVVADSPEDPVAIEAKEKGQKVRYNQPRNENGQFTYNSANSKGLSTETSRGHTKPPFLAGVDLTFIKKGSTFQYKDEEDNLNRIISSIDMTAEELVNSCKVYFKTEGGFLGVIGTAVTKKGSPSKIEKTGVTGKTGEIDLETKSEQTQAAVEEASKKKDVSALEAQKKASEEASGAYLKTKYNQGVKKQQPTSSNTTVGAGSGMATQSKPSAPVQPKPQAPQQPQKPLNTTKIFTKKNENQVSNQQPDLNANFGENIKQEIKADPKQWVQKNKNIIKQVIQKHPETTVNAIVNAVYSGKVKNWNQLLK